MSETNNYLGQFESFDEFDDKQLLINEKSNVYMLIYFNNRYIVWEKVDFATINKYNNKEYLEVQKSFYNILDGRFILKINELYDNETNKRVLIKPNGIRLLLLSDILKLDDLESVLLDKEKVLKLTRNSK